MAWIKMRRELVDHPKVKAIARQLELTNQHVNGCLHAVWSYADVHAEQERVDLMLPEDVDQQAGISGFAEAMQRVGWLDWDEDGVVFIDYEQHNGTTAKQRAQSAKRVQRHRQRGRPAPVAKAPRRTATEQPDTPSGTALADPPADDSRRFPNNWCHEVMNQYPRHRRGGPVKAYEVIREALTRIEARFNEPREAVEWLTARVKAYAASPAGKAGRHVVSLQRWMQEGRYDEDAEAWQIGADDEPRSGKSQPPSAAYQRQPTEEERRIQAKRLAAIEKRKQKGGA